MTELLNIAETVYDDLVKEAFEVLKDGEVSFGELVHLGGVMAAKANLISTLNLVQKKHLIVDVAVKALEKVEKEVLSSLSDSQRESFSQKLNKATEFVKEALPAVLDVAAGGLNMGKAKSLMSVLARVLCCSGGTLPELPSAVKKLVPAGVDVSGVLAKVADSLELRTPESAAVVPASESAAAVPASESAAAVPASESAAAAPEPAVAVPVPEPAVAAPVPEPTPEPETTVVVEVSQTSQESGETPVNQTDESSTVTAVSSTESQQNLGSVPEETQQTLSA